MSHDSHSAFASRYSWMGIRGSSDARLITESDFMDPGSQPQYRPTSHGKTEGCLSCADKILVTCSKTQDVGLLSALIPDQVDIHAEASKR
jgi:hypothetical protein